MLPGRSVLGYIPPPPSPLEAPISRDVRALLLFLLGWIPASLLLMLYASSFFVSWDGHAVSVRPARSPEPKVWEVLVVDDDGSQHEVTWPASAIEGIRLPVDALAIPPKPIPEDRPRTFKSAFSLSFTLTPAGEGASARTVSTATPQALGLAFICMLVGLGLRNMWWSGSPISIAASPLELPKGQAPMGSPAAPPSSGEGDGGSSRRKPQKGPPPPKRRRGRGR